MEEVPRMKALLEVVILDADVVTASVCPENTQTEEEEI